MKFDALFLLTFSLFHLEKIFWEKKLTKNIFNSKKKREYSQKSFLIERNQIKSFLMEIESCKPLEF